MSRTDTRPSLYVTLRPYAGPPFVRAIPFDVPRWLAGTGAESRSRPAIRSSRAGPAESLRNLVDNLRKGLFGAHAGGDAEHPGRGRHAARRLVPTLPASVIATLRPTGGSRRGEAV